MADNDITWDSSSLEAGLTQLLERAQDNVKKAVENVANEVLRLSQFEVPHDTGNLQNSGHVENGNDDYEKRVGYNTVYAAYQHEGDWPDGTHVIRNYQAGRKGKYLEDPIRANLGTFNKYFNGIINP